MSKLIVEKWLLNLIWTKSDQKIINTVISEAYAHTGMKTSFDINNPLSFVPVMSSLKSASKLAGRNICNDLPKEIESLLTKKEWESMRVEYEHYNNSLDEIKDKGGSFMDFMLFYFYETKLRLMIENGFTIQSQES